MRPFLLFTFLLLPFASFAQEKYSYLRVKIVHYSLTDSTSCYFEAEKGNAHAAEVYALQSEKQSTRLKDQTQYANTTAVINKIIAAGWELFGVDPQIITTKVYEEGRFQHTDTHSENYYIFRKQLTK